MTEILDYVQIEISRVNRRRHLQNKHSVSDIKINQALSREKLKAKIKAAKQCNYCGVVTTTLSRHLKFKCAKNNREKQNFVERGERISFA